MQDKTKDHESQDGIYNDPSLKLDGATGVMLEEQQGQDIVDFRTPLWNKISLAYSSVSVIACISLCRELFISKTVK